MPRWELIENTLAKAIAASVSIVEKQRVSGGCINESYSITTRCGQRFFVKVNDSAFSENFATEALALNEIYETNTVRVPLPICLGTYKNESFLILEFISIGHAASDSWQSLGEQLAKMHAKPQSFFGWKHDNVIGSTPQPNPRTGDWIDFFRIHRLEHQIKLCRDNGLKLDRVDKLLDSIPSLFHGYTPRASLLHGDLWSGNISFDETGNPFAFDPCSYYGDRETDLAFTEFFGGFHHDFYQSYRKTWPLDNGYEHRKTLYNLYHCLNHFYLFGGSYGTQAQAMTNLLLAKIK